MQRELKATIVDRLYNTAPCKALRSCIANNLSEVFGENKKKVVYDLVSFFIIAIKFLQKNVCASFLLSAGDRRRP